MPTLSDIDSLRLRFQRRLLPQQRRQQRRQQEEEEEEEEQQPHCDSSDGSDGNGNNNGNNNNNNTIIITPGRRRARSRPSEDDDDDGDDAAALKKCRLESPNTNAIDASRRFAYADVLFQPQLLYELRTDEELESENPLLEFCLDGGFKLSRPTAKEYLPRLLQICSPDESFTQDKVEQLRAVLNQNKGCDNKGFFSVNATNSKGLTAMHFLIIGCTKDSFYCTLQGVYLLLSAGLDVSLTDRQGNTPFTALATLLDKDLTVEAVALAHLLRRQAACDVNHANAAGRTLLAAAASKGDRASELTRLLLNLGASVWPPASTSSADVVAHVARELRESALAWLLRAVSSGELSLSEADETIYLLGSSMGAEDPARMRAHLSRMFLHLGRAPRADGAVFAEVRRRMERFWTRPQPLKFLCLRRIRSTIGPKNLSDASCMKRKLEHIPNTMLQYLQLG